MKPENCRSKTLSDILIYRLVENELLKQNVMNFGRFKIFL